MASETQTDQGTDNKGRLWVMNEKFDPPMDEEAVRLRTAHPEENISTLLLLQLAFQSLGVVYGDLGTSPLYVFYNTFPNGIEDTEDVIGALSLIIYTITLILLLKYVFIVCRANDNGQGGTFALYSLLCRHANIRTTPDKDKSDEQLTTYSHFPIHEKSFAAKTQIWLEKKALRKNLLLVLILIGSCMVIGDGVLTPAISVTAGFKNQYQIGNASGIAVVIVMLVTTFLMILIMLLVWCCHWILVLIFTGLSLIVEGTYFSSAHFKVNQGGWVLLVIATAFFVIMASWHYGTVKRYQFEVHSKVSMGWILGLGPSLGLVRVPGVGLVYSELAHGVPHIFSHFITNLPAVHSVLVFVCIKYLPVYTVPEAERFLVRRIGPKNFCMFRCIARYRYKDLHKKDDEFERRLFNSLARFVRLESLMDGCSDTDSYSEIVYNDANQTYSSYQNPTMSSMDSIVRVESLVNGNHTIVSMSGQSTIQLMTEQDELELLMNCRNAGVVHILGNTVVAARRDSKMYNKIIIDVIYAFLRKICRGNSAVFRIPHECLLNVGQVIHV